MHASLCAWEGQAQFPYSTATIVRWLSKVGQDVGSALRRQMHALGPYQEMSVDNTDWLGDSRSTAGRSIPPGGPWRGA